ncbi:MAG: hypothetical protein ACRDUA_19755, partial [Micromonosporaceae bacterium]
VMVVMVLGWIELLIRGLKLVVDIAAKIPGPHQAAMKKLSGALDGAADHVRGLRREMAGLKSKKVDVRLLGRDAFLKHVAEMRRALSGLTSKGVRVAGVTGRGGFSERAHGGPVTAGRTYLVGERGPELLTMGGSSGNITPNHQLPEVSGGAPEIHVYIGDRELRDIVRVEQRSRDKSLKRRVTAGAGAYR